MLVYLKFLVLLINVLEMLWRFLWNGQCGGKVDELRCDQWVSAIILAHGTTSNWKIIRFEQPKDVI